MPKSFMVPFVALSAALALVGCDDGPSNASADASDSFVSIEGSGNDSGNVSLNLPGLSAKIRVPSEIMAGSKFDIDGVTLFPGSKVSAIKVGSADDAFRMTFDAPADPAKVAAWFQNRFTQKAMAVSATGNRLAGKTTDGNAFTIDLAPGVAGHSTGTIRIADKN